MNIEPEKLLLDANVLIDFFNSDFSILSDIRRHIAEIFVLSDILEFELPDISISDCHEVGLAIIDPKDHVSKESETELGQLSPEDRLNLFTAVDSGYSLVTNDVKLRKACEQRNIKIIWGLQLLLMLVEKSEYSIDDARVIGENMCDSNDYISEEIVNDFISKIEKIRYSRI